MDNNLENKAKFFAQHFDSEAIWRTSELNENVDEVTWEFKNFKYLNETDYLELKPLSSITDEDAKNYLHSIGCHSLGERIQQAKKQLQEDFDADLYSADYLKSKGYALPWMGLSVEKQLEYGWIKLKND